MALTDTGPLVALIDRNDLQHADCAAHLAHLAPPMAAPWPCFTEAMRLLDRAGGHQAQDALWEYVTLGALVIRASDGAEQARMRALMAAHTDRPMQRRGIADAILTAKQTKFSKTNPPRVRAQHGIPLRQN